MKQIESGQKILSHIWRGALLLATVILFAMSVVSPVNAAPNNEKGPRCTDGIDNDGDTLIDADDPDCAGDEGDPSTYYLVTIDWPPLAGESDYWVAGGGSYWTSENRSVEYAPFDPDFIEGLTTGVLELDFFQDYFGAKGTECFPDNDDGTSTVFLHGAAVSYRKSTGALARFWFEGYTHSLNPRVEVLYLLSFFKGQLVDEEEGWPPSSSNTVTWGELIESSEWKLRPENQGADIQANSCVRERGEFVEDPEDTWNGPVFIDIDVEIPPQQP
jgi:hypothetical protein